MKDLGEDRAMTEKALKLLRAGKLGAYEKALETLHPDTLQAWKEWLEVLLMDRRGGGATRLAGGDG